MNTANDIVGVIDAQLDAVLRYPLMFGVHCPHTMEIVVMNLLNIRFQWSPQVITTPPWKTVYGMWITDYFEDESPRNLTADGRLAARFGWKQGDTCHNHETTWPKIIEFYAHLVRRTREGSHTPRSIPKERLP